MAKTLPLAEKDEAAYLASVGSFLEGGLPQSYRYFVLDLRNQGFSATYSAHMVRLSQEFLVRKMQEMLRRGEAL